MVTGPRRSSPSPCSWWPIDTWAAKCACCDLMVTRSRSLYSVASLRTKCHIKAKVTLMIYHKAESPCGIDECVCARVDTWIQSRDIKIFVEAGLWFWRRNCSKCVADYMFSYPTFSPFKSHQFIETVSVFLLLSFALECDSDACYRANMHFFYFVFSTFIIKKVKT